MYPVRWESKTTSKTGYSPACGNEWLAALDTLLLALPISWNGHLQQYDGHLHREHACKADVRIIDFVDTGYLALIRMWDKRQRG